MASDFGEEAGLLTILAAAGQLKGLPRAGWLRVGLPSAESVADHSYRVALLALLFGPRLGLNADKLIRLALVHDLAEARVGDLTPADGVPASEKRSREAAALAAIVQGAPEGPALFDLWQEYDQGITPEARAARQLDKLEMALQTLEYEEADGPGRPKAWADEFWDSARAAITDPLILRFFEFLRAKRPNP